MDASRVGWTLRGFLALVVVLLAWGLGRQMGRIGFDEALAQVLDGDPDRDERLAALGVLRDSRDPDRPERVLVAAMAGLLLDDAQMAADLTSDLINFAGSDPWLESAALGEPCLRSLVAALAAENRGDVVAARTLFERAELSATLWKVPLVAQVAGEGLARLR